MYFSRIVTIIVIHFGASVGALTFVFMEQTNVALLGAGWLGKPLIAELVTAGYSVRASYRKEADRTAIVATGGGALPVDLPERGEAISTLIREAGTVIITLPPRGRKLGERATEHYLTCLAALSGLLADKHVVYTSSTGVYGSATGWVDEATATAADTASGRAVVAAEAWLAEQTERLTVLRLAGLYGPGRDPANFFGQRAEISQGDAPVNMVHREDVLVALLLTVRERPIGTFNVSAATHPDKRTFYTRMFKRAGLPLKVFIPGGADGKRIDSSKLRSLGWRPRYDDLTF